MAPQLIPPSPCHRRQSLIDGQNNSPLRPGARRFYHIADHFDAAADLENSQYNRSRLIRLTYNHACSPLSQDTFLRAFFGSLDLSIDGDELDIESLDEDIETNFFGFADYLFDKSDGEP